MAINNGGKAMNYAWMSQASYLDLSSVGAGNSNTLIQELTTSDYNKDKLLAEQQAATFTAPTTGYSFISTHPNDRTGFSATVFKSNADNTYTIAVRGTEPFEGFLTDLVWADVAGVVAAGMAIPQLIQAFRYYKQITTAAGQDVQYSASELDMLGRLQARSMLGEYGADLLPEAVAQGIGAIGTQIVGDKQLMGSASIQS